MGASPSQRNPDHHSDDASNNGQANRPNHALSKQWPLSQHGEEIKLNTHTAALVIFLMPSTMAAVDRASPVHQRRPPQGEVRLHEVSLRRGVQSVRQIARRAPQPLHRHLVQVTGYLGCVDDFIDLQAQLIFALGYANKVWRILQQ